MNPSTAITLGLALGLAACAPAERGAAARIVVADSGLAQPESILYDSVADVYLVSNVNGDPLARDGNGFIARVLPSGTVEALKWIDGATPGVALNAPKGMAIVADTLFVADIDVLRRFDRTSGSPLGGWPVPGATFLNGVAASGDTVYATDTGLRAGKRGTEDSGTDAVYRFDGATPVSLARGPNLGRPNGIVAGPQGLTVVTLGSGSVYRLDPRTGARTDLPIPDAGQLDGIVLLPDGSALISSWRAKAIYRQSAEGAYSIAVDSLTAPAGIGWDGKRRRVLIPLPTQNRLIFQTIP